MLIQAPLARLSIIWINFMFIYFKILSFYILRRNLRLFAWILVYFTVAAFVKLSNKSFNFIQHTNSALKMNIYIKPMLHENIIILVSGQYGLNILSLNIWLQLNASKGPWQFYFIPLKEKKKWGGGGSNVIIPHPNTWKVNTGSNLHLD